MSHWGAGLFVVLLGVVMVLNWTARGRLETRLVPLRMAGEATTIGELAPEPVAEEDNAAAQLLTFQPQLETFSADYGAFFATPLGEEYQERREQGLPPTAAQTAEIEKIMAPYGDLLANVQQASRCEAYASLLDFSVDQQQFLEQQLNSTSPVRTAARLLAWQVEVLVARGDVDAAIVTGTDALRLERLYDDEPILISFLVANACRQIAIGELNHAMRQGPVNEDVRAGLREELARYDGPARFEQALREERALGLDALSQMSGGTVGRTLIWWTTD